MAKKRVLKSDLEAEILKLKEELSNIRWERTQERTRAEKAEQELSSVAMDAKELGRRVEHVQVAVKAAMAVKAPHVNLDYTPPLYGEETPNLSPDEPTEVRFLRHLHWLCN